jgi:hypothetical protein
MTRQPQNPELSQMNLFPVNPEIKNLGVVDVKLKAGALDISMIAATEATDLAMIQPEQWGKAVAEWLVRLCADKEHLAEAYLNFAILQYSDECKAREKDTVIGFARGR